MRIRTSVKVCFAGLVALAAFWFLFNPHKGAADQNTTVGGGTDPTRTLKMDNKSEEWNAIVRRLTEQRNKQIAEQQAARQKAVVKPKAVVVQPKPVVQRPPVVAVSGTKADWMRAAGIPEAHWGYVDSIVSRESGWNPNSVNKSSGACGLGQQLPCGKWPGAWNDPVAALRAMTGYVNARYGGWGGAVAFWNAHHWY